MTHADFIDSLGLRYFKGSEFAYYFGRSRDGVRNSEPTRAMWPNIVPTLLVLDEIRHQLGAPVTLVSTYRNPEYNKALGGAPKSQHMEYRAIDFKCAKGAPEQWADVARMLRGTEFRATPHTPAFTFSGGVGVYPSFVHVDTRGKNANW